MDTKKLHFLITFVSYPITILHFIFGDYTNEKLISGIIFYSAAAVVYVGFVYLFSKSDIGKILVMWGLLLIGIILIFLAHTTA